MSSFDSSRKRKQDFGEVNKASWLDYVHSPPPDSALDFSFDSMFSPLDSQPPYNAFDHCPSPRRHSVAVSDLGHLTKQEFDLQQPQPQYSHHWDTGFQHLFGTSMPSSWSSSSSSGISSLGGGFPHQRAYSLHLESSPHDLGAVSAASPTTPAFFSPSFLDALNAESDSLSANAAFVDAGMLHEHDFMMTNQPPPLSTNTITPSILSAGPSLHHGESFTPFKLEDPKPEKRRTKKTSPPMSPSHTGTSSTSTSSSPSPPITPMQSASFSVIPEEEDEDMIDRQGTRDSTNAAVSLKPLVQQYLLGDDAVVSGERTVMVLTSKVAQKSYGTEKRFLCPPPTTILSGASWWTVNTEEDAATPSAEPSKPFLPSLLNAPKLTIHISSETAGQSSVLEWYTSSGSILDASSSVLAASNASAGGDTAMCGKCVSKHLHINDADEKRKRVEMLAKIQLGNGTQLGTFASKGIKVISKPSKKRQSIKNLELCIHHGTTISLFNRIRSQTVSTKYLGVSNGQGGSVMRGGQGTCFVARTGSWDPFVIWVVDTSKSLDATVPPRATQHPTHPHYPAPPAIALQAPTADQNPVAVHYNQPVVLQCVTTGLVSPVMVIRKVDKGSMVLGGNRVDDIMGNVTGGECGDEALGDPVSQLHKVAFQIVQDPSLASMNLQTQAGYGFTANPTEWTLPQTCQPVTYLACLNDVVGMHKTATPRTFVSTRPPPVLQHPAGGMATAESWSDGTLFSTELMSLVVSSQDNGKVTRKRRVSCDVAKPASFPARFQSVTGNKNRRRVNSLNDAAQIKIEGGVRRGSVTDRRTSVSSDLGSQVDGACWTEDVSDASVWTIVGTDCATYTFWMPPSSDTFSPPFQTTSDQPPSPAMTITPFPTVSNMKVSSSSAGRRLTLTGEHFSPRLSVWFGDVQAPCTDYKSRELISCTVPEVELRSSPVVTNGTNGAQVPVLLVRDDGLVCRTDQFFMLQ